MERPSDWQDRQSQMPPVLFPELKIRYLRYIIEVLDFQFLIGNKELLLQ